MRVDRLERLRQLRNAAMLNAESLTDEQAANMPTMFGEWAVGVEYKVDGRRSYGESCTNAAKPTLLRQTGHQMSLPHCGQ